MCVKGGQYCYYKKDDSLKIRVYLIQNIFMKKSFIINKERSNKTMKNRVITFTNWQAFKFNKKVTISLIVLIFLISGGYLTSFAQSTTFAVIGDYGVDDTNEGNVATMVASWNPDFVVTVGDNIDDGVAGYSRSVGYYYHQFLYPHDKSYGGGDTSTSNHFWPAVGNHDFTSGGINNFYAYFVALDSSRYYTKQIGDIEFFFLSSDSSHEANRDGTEINSIQGQYMIPKIQNSTARWKIVIYHHCTYSSNTLPYPGGEYWRYWMDWPFEDYGVDAVLTGHVHIYERIFRDDNHDGKDLVYFVDGLGGKGKDNVNYSDLVGGSQFQYNSNWGAMKVIEGGDSLRFEFHSISAGYPLIDSYTLYKSPMPVELTTFTAIPISPSSVQLKWTTATEVDDYGFEVERENKNSNWQDIGFVAGSGNSNSPKEYSFTDNPSGGTKFSYRLKQIDEDGKFKYYDAITVNLAVSNQPQLLQNSPNPFNPSTTIKYYIPNTSDVTIKIYDILGREVNTLINQQATAGYHIVYWNGEDSKGEDVASGVYLYRLTAGSFSETKKMNLLK